MEMSQSILKNADLKSTKKRCLLLSILQTEDRAMTAEELLEKATPILPMNASTVYRTLNTLTEKEVLSKSLRKDGKSYFSLESFNRFLIISLDVLICRYSPLLRAFPALFISEEPHKSFYYPSCFHSQK